MWHPALATNPYGLVAVSVAAALVVGSLGVTKARIGITLTLMTMSTVILVSVLKGFTLMTMSTVILVSVLKGFSTVWGCCFCW